MFSVEPSGARGSPAPVHSDQGEEAGLQPDGKPGTILTTSSLTFAHFYDDQGKRVVIVLDLEVLQKGELVAKKIGNPVTIGSDGKVGVCGFSRLCLS